MNRLNSRGKPRKPIFNEYPREWDNSKRHDEFCFECHEELLHNPVFLYKDIEKFRKLVCLRRLNEVNKPANKRKIGERVKLLHEVVERGLEALLIKK